MKLIALVFSLNLIMSQAMANPPVPTETCQELRANLVGTVGVVSASKIRKLEEGSTKECYIQPQENCGIKLKNKSRLCQNAQNIDPIIPSSCANLRVDERVICWDDYRWFCRDNVMGRNRAEPQQYCTLGDFDQEDGTFDAGAIKVYPGKQIPGVTDPGGP